MQKAQNEMSVDTARMMFPKKSWGQPERSKTMKAEIPESELQKFANEAILLRGWQYIRFSSALMGYLKRSAPEWAQRAFFRQVAGRMPDSIIMVPVAQGMFLTAKMELKTQDKQGRAVGKLHGKQKNYAEAEGWFIARSPEEIDSVLNKIEKIVTKIKKLDLSV